MKIPIELQLDAGHGLCIRDSFFATIIRGRRDQKGRNHRARCDVRRVQNVDREFEQQVTVENDHVGVRGPLKSADVR